MFWLLNGFIVLACLSLTLLLAVVLCYPSEEQVVRMQVPAVTAVVPVRNEATAIKAVLESVAYLQRNCAAIKEVIIVDDHSSDGTAQLMRTCGSYPSFTLLTLHAATGGKKKAIDEAIKLARFEWILTIDADTVPQPETIDAALRELPQSAKMLLLSLKPAARSSHWHVAAFFDLEFVALHHWGLLTASMGRPTLCNGALLLFEKEAYMRSRSYRKDWHLASGDDLFNMFAIKKRYGRKSIRAVSTYRPQGTVGFDTSSAHLWKQRKRWMGKTSSISEAAFTWSAWIVLAAQVALFSGFIALAAGVLAQYALLTMLCLLLAESVFLIRACMQSSSPQLVLYIPLAVLTYPIYLLSLVGASLSTNPGASAWK